MPYIYRCKIEFNTAISCKVEGWNVSEILKDENIRELECAKLRSMMLQYYGSPLTKIIMKSF